LKIPIQGQLPSKIIPKKTDAYIKNPYPGKELLTQEEALECINSLAGMLVIDKRYRNNINGG